MPAKPSSERCRLRAGRPRRRAGRRRRCGHVAAPGAASATRKASTSTPRCSARSPSWPSALDYLEHRPRAAAGHARPHGRDARRGATSRPTSRTSLNADYCIRWSRRCRCRISRPCSASRSPIPLAWFASYNMTPSRRFVYPVARLIIMALPLGARDDLDDPAGRDPRLRHAARRARADALLHRLRRQAVRRGDRGDRARARSRRSARPAPTTLQVFVYAVLPQVRVAWTGISIYTWDVVFRAATVVGFFGAGGMGWYLRESVQRVASQDVAAILLSIIVVVRRCPNCSRPGCAGASPRPWPERARTLNTYEESP